MEGKLKYTSLQVYFPIIAYQSSDHYNAGEKQQQKTIYK